MGWTDTHLHQFLIRGEYYGVPDEEEVGQNLFYRSRVAVHEWQLADLRFDLPARNFRLEIAPNFLEQGVQPSEECFLTSTV